MDELVSFIGASYFRFLGRDQRYGLSARGLAIGAGDPAVAEEFPHLTEFWIAAPSAGARQIRVLALLESPSATGAYEFTFSPGEFTSVEVRASLFARVEITRLGIAPLSSMFLSGSADRHNHRDEFRSNVHDSDLLLARTAEQNWIARPLNNPRAFRRWNLDAPNVGGFGLLQRERKFENYQDLEAQYEARPGYWITPGASWGPGSIALLEMPADSEGQDNIAAFWSPAEPMAAGSTREWQYGIKASANEAAPRLGYVAATHHSNGKRIDDILERAFYIDFVGGELKFLSATLANLSTVIDSPGIEAKATIAPHRFNGGVRVRIQARAPADSDALMQAYLIYQGRRVSETWVTGFHRTQ